MAAPVDLMNSDLYSDYYDPSNNYIINETPVRDFGSVSSLARGILTILLRAGYIFIQIGSIPICDVNLILLQNLVEISVGTICYGLVGYLFAFGEDYNGTLGIRNWIMSTDADMDDAIIGWSAVMTTTAIFTTMVAGRMHFVGYFIVTALISGLVQPLTMHWIWSKNGFMHKHMFVSQLVSYKDMGGGGVIHVLAGVVALYAAMFMGRRLMRLRDIDESSIPPSAPGAMVVGYLLVLLGLIGLGLPTPYYELTHIPSNYATMILMNNIMAAAGGIATVTVLQFIFAKDLFNIWIVLRCLQGALAGVVVIAPGVDVYNPVISFGLSIPAGIIFFFSSREIFKTPLEDYCNLVSIHLICGFLGTLLPPLCGTGENLGSSATHLMIVHFGWQAVCGLILLAVYFVGFLPLFLALYGGGCMRNRYDELDHRRALTVVSRGPDRSCMQRLFRPGSDPDMLLPGYDTKNEAYQESRLTEEAEMNLRYLNPKNGTIARDGGQTNRDGSSKVYDQNDTRTQASRKTNAQMYMALTDQKFQPNEESECKELTNILKDLEANKESVDVELNETNDCSLADKTKSKWPGGDTTDRVLKGDSENPTVRRKKGIYTITGEKETVSESSSFESIPSNVDDISPPRLNSDSSTSFSRTSPPSTIFTDNVEERRGRLEQIDYDSDRISNPPSIEDTDIQCEIEITGDANVGIVDNSTNDLDEEDDSYKNLDKWFGAN